MNDRALFVFTRMDPEEDIVELRRMLTKRHGIRDFVSHHASDLLLNHQLPPLGAKLAARSLIAAWPESLTKIAGLLRARNLQTKDTHFLLLCWLSEIWYLRVSRKRCAEDLIVDFLRAGFGSHDALLMACDLVVDHMPIRSALRVIRRIREEVTNKRSVEQLLGEFDYHAPVNPERVRKLRRMFEGKRSSEGADRSQLHS